MRKVKIMKLSLLCIIVFAFLLAGCSGKKYEESYQAGYMAGKSEVYPDAYGEGYADGYEKGMSDILVVPESDNNQNEPMKPWEENGFVLVTDVIPEAILEIRYYSSFNFVGERIDGYEEPVAFLTKEAADALKKVSDDLMEQGYRIKIYDAYRPQTAVSHFKTWAADTDDVRMKEYFYPELDKSVLFKKGYIASRSGHSRGSTVDLTLVDMKTGTEADMGGPYDFFGQISHPGYTETLTDEQIANRYILRDAMQEHGFDGISTEWWHFELENEPYPDTYFDFPINLY